MKSKHSLPLELLRETYRPLAFFASEMLLAAAPFLPDFAVAWARRVESERKTLSHAKSQRLKEAKEERRGR